MRNSSFVLPLPYCRGSKFVLTSFCFQTVPKRELTSAAWITDRNSEKWSQKGYHSLPFAVKVSVFSVLLNSFIVWITDIETFRIIQSHHVTYTKVFLTASRNTAAYCIIFLTVWKSRLRQQISTIPSLYKASLSFRWNDEGKQAIRTKAECFEAWRLFLFSSLFL